MKAYYGFDLEIVQYGKPQPTTFQYCEKSLRDYADKNGIELTNFYMIGDTPDSDIQGSNNQGWISILVKTGIFQGPENSKEYPAKYIF